jgi:hypothetical protein
VKRWFFGKLSTRSNNHLVTSYHLTSRTGGSLLSGLPVRRVRMVQKIRAPPSAAKGKSRAGLRPPG